MFFVMFLIVALMKKNYYRNITDAYLKRHYMSSAQILILRKKKMSTPTHIHFVQDLMKNKLRLHSPTSNAYTYIQGNLRNKAANEESRMFKNICLYRCRYYQPLYWCKQWHKHVANSISSGTKELRTYFFSGAPAVYFFTSEYIQLPYQRAGSDVR